MKKLMYLFFIFSVSAFAQTENYVNILQTFQEYYNNEDAEVIFETFNKDMKEAVPLETLNRLVTTFNAQLGKLNRFSFQRKEGATETYLVEFEKANQIMHLTLDAKGKISGLRFLPAENPDVKPKITRNSTPFILPFKGEWFTVWGGDTKAQNYHVVSGTQRHAFDFLILGKNNRTYERSGTRNEDYYAFGKPVYAVCDATVVQVIEGVEDNRPTQMNPAEPTGNTVILKAGENEYIVYAHFEKGTIKVKEGDVVKQGQFLGSCGNSGNSTEPHIHLHVQDGPDLMTAVGVKCYFKSLMVNGELKTDFSPVRLDKIGRVEE